MSQMIRVKIVGRFSFSKQFLTLLIDANDGEDCVSFTAWNGKWNDDDCNKEFNYICQIYDQLDSYPELNLDKSWPTTGGCKEGWLKYGKACFKVCS